ncbi:hypothetical protein [Rathayibacter tritici]|uniref:hypothetical protein n=1 Tax=Rathayibacter tritici TaxID=33888 RepID=UPI000AA00CCC|nr:hypothetical protein [Rathayibacter tritici]
MPGLGRYGSAATNAVLAAVNELDPRHRAPGNVGLIIIGENPLREEQQQLHSQGAAVSPRRFAETSPSTMAGAVADVFQTIGPAVVLLMRWPAAEPAAAFYTNLWLSTGKVQRVIICVHSWTDDVEHRVDVTVLGNYE